MPRILIIDDEKSIRNTLKEILEYEGYSVDEAADGPTGLDKPTWRGNHVRYTKFSFACGGDSVVFFNQLTVYGGHYKRSVLFHVLFHIAKVYKSQKPPLYARGLR